MNLCGCGFDSYRELGFSFFRNNKQSVLSQVPQKGPSLLLPGERNKNPSCATLGKTSLLNIGTESFIRDKCLYLMCFNENIQEKGSKTTWQLIDR